MKFKNFALLAIILFILSLTNCFLKSGNSKVVKFTNGMQVTIFEIYNPETERTEIVVTPDKFKFDGVNLPSDYIKILLEGGFLFDATLYFNNGQVFVQNCGGTSSNYNFIQFGSKSIIDIVFCQRNDCCSANEDTKDVIRISQKCFNYVCD